MGWGNLHTHTVFSDGRHSMEENCRAAVASGMDYLGFSDHAYGPSDTAWCMAPEALAGYLAEARRLKEKFDGELEIYLGIEADDQSIPVEEQLDFVLGAVHTLRLPEGYFSVDYLPEIQQQCIDRAFGGNPVDFAKCYFDRVVAMTERLRPTAVAHFDLITKCGLMPEEDPVYRDYARQALEAVIALCPYIEVNTGGMARGYRNSPYPADFLLETVLASGGKVVLGSDSHHKDNLLYAFPETVATLKKLGFESIARFNGKSFEDIPI